MWIIRIVSIAITLSLVSTAAVERRPFGMTLVASDELGGGDATLSPDGRRFVTTSRRSGQWELWTYDIEAKRWTQITRDRGENFEGKWSPDSSRLVFTSSRAGQKDVWTLDLTSGAERQLTSSSEDDEYPAWSPDGRTIVYTGGPWNARDIFVVPADGGEPRKVTRRSGKAGACTFEPSGDTLICHRYDSGTGDVERVWVRDGESAPLTAGAPWDYKPATSPDNRLIAFSRSVEGPSHIWLLPASGGRAWQLTNTPGDDRWPTWSRDSRRVLFHRSVDASLGVETIASGAAAPRIAVPEEERPLQASREADGRRVAYCADTPSGKRVRVRDTRTGRTADVDTDGREACYPRWSPRGDRLALVVRNGDRWEVAVVPASGGGLRMLTADHAELRGMDGPIDWSPDGRRLVFHADTAPFEARLYTADLSTGAIAPVTDGGYFDEAPSWTPDGRGVLFMSTRGGNWTWGLYRLALDTGVIAPFVAPDWTEKNYPRERADGGHVWIASADGADRVMEQPRGGAARTLPGSSPGARWPELARDGASVLYTRVVHRVEFWIIDNPDGAGAPSPDHPAAPAPPALARGPAGDGASPRDFNRR